MKRFEVIEHPADVGFVAYGADLPELFENAALALCSLACSPEKIEERRRCGVAGSGGDLESLLYGWLAEILAIADADQMVFRRVEVVNLSEPKAGAPGEVRGIAHGQPYDRDRHCAGTYIKAVTWHQFSVERTANGYRARVFLDL